MWCDRFADPALRPHLPTGPVDGERGDRSVRALTRKQPRAWAGTLPIIPEQLEQSRRQHDIAVFAALTLLDPDDHPLAVDGRRCEADGFGDPQTSCVADGQSHAVFQVFD